MFLSILLAHLTRLRDIAERAFSLLTAAYISTTIFASAASLTAHTLKQYGVILPSGVIMPLFSRVIISSPIYNFSLSTSSMHAYAIYNALLVENAPDRRPMPVSQPRIAGGHSPFRQFHNATASCIGLRPAWAPYQICAFSPPQDSMRRHARRRVLIAMPRRSCRNMHLPAAATIDGDARARRRGAPRARR